MHNSKNQVLFWKSAEVMVNYWKKKERLCYSLNDNNSNDDNINYLVHHHNFASIACSTQWYSQLGLH